MSTPKLVALMVVLTACNHAETPREAFEARVQPILERTCAASACHGVAPGAEAHGEQIDWTQLYFKLDDDGKFADVDQAYRAAKHAINTIEDPAFSPLLRKPLAPSHGGQGHLGGTNFGSPENPDYQTISAWISMETNGGSDPVPLSDNEQLFADTVQPVLVEATCMTSRCHGPTAGGTPYHLDVGYDGRFPIDATRNNYKETLRMATLDGYPLLSRVLRKALPLGRGIVHKALAFDFFANNPGGGVAAISNWICAERLSRTGLGCATPRQAPITGFVFVRGPILPRHAFDLEGFTPGSDLYLAGGLSAGSLVPSSTENLTGGLHPEGPADVRSPAVSRDGQDVLFAMRTSAEEGHHLWTIDLTTRKARQLTFGNGLLPGGGLATDRDPTWGPDGTVWFSSTRAGVVADEGRRLDADIYSLDPATGEVRRWTYTPHVERRPVFFDLGDEAGGEIAFSSLRDAIPGQARAHVFRFPPNQATEYHQHFGITPTQTFFYDMQELPDGRYVSVVGDLPAVWGAGQLGIIDRNFGPEINDRSADPRPALEMYRPPMVLLAGDGAYRDPATLPDGRILVAHKPGAFDAKDDAASFTPRIELLELSEASDGSGPTVGAATVLVAEPGVALTEPEPISARAPVRLDGPPLAPNQEPTAVFRHQGLPMVNAMLANLPPSGKKELRDDIAFVRLIEHLPMTPAERAPIAPEEGDGDVDGQATSSALGTHGPARVLAELPVEPDGSFQVRVPTNLPFRVQPLNADRMAVGTMHNRWYYTLGGQVLNQGVSAAMGTVRYSSQCGACHGDPNGVGGRPLEQEAPDAVTGASLSLSRYTEQNPRRPIDPVVAGPATRVEVDFRRDVQPILERRCVSCHGASSPAGGLSLTTSPTAHFTTAYEQLLAPGTGSGNARAYVDDGDGRARTSYLVELVTGRELDAPRALTTQGTPHPSTGQGSGPLTDEERLVLIRWIELGATFQGLGHGGTP